METTQRYLIENELSRIEDEISTFQDLAPYVPEEDQEKYDGRITALEDNMERVRDTFALFCESDEKTWSDVENVFLNGIEEVRSAIKTIREEFEHRSMAFYDSFN